MSVMTKRLPLLPLLICFCGAVERSVYAITPPPPAWVVGIVDGYRLGFSADFGAVSALLEAGEASEIVAGVYWLASLHSKGDLPPAIADGAGNTLLHLVASASHSGHRFEITEDLIRQEANVNAVNDAGWAPLHVALTAGVDGGLDGSAPKQLVELLVRNGADVNAATAIYGWTPLHMAAAMHGAEMVSLLIELGADVGTRSRIDGLTPLDVVGWREECSHLQGSDSGEVAAALGAKKENPTAGNGVSAEANICMPRPEVIHGAFTAAGANEKLAFVARHIVLIDEEQRPRKIVRPPGRYATLKKLCFDPVSKTHTLVFRSAFEGNATPNEAVYLHYNSTSAAFAEVFSKEDLDDEWSGFLENSDEVWRRGPWSHCTWREEKELVLAVRNAVDALRVDKSDFSNTGLAGDVLHDDLDGPKESVLRTRVVPAALVEEHLDNIRQWLSNLPTMEKSDFGELSIPTIKEYFGESSRWRVVVIEDGRLFPSNSYQYGLCGGLMLIYDAENKIWRTVYDCADIRHVVVYNDRLHGTIADDNCGTRSKGLFCYFEVDLLTWLPQWWDYNYASDWTRDRERPGTP